MLTFDSLAELPFTTVLMRVISGLAGSLPLRVPPSLTRPTTDRVREAVFSSLGERIVQARVLDLFAGSGSLGIEALSRGATEAVFVEEHHEAITTIRQNLESTHLNGGIIHQQNVRSFLSTLSEADFSIIFADPPYAKTSEGLEFLKKLLAMDTLACCLSPGGVFVLESFAKQPLPSTKLWEIFREKKYGKTRVSYLRPLT